MNRSSKPKIYKCTKRCRQCEIKHEFICPVLIVFEVVLVICVLALAALSA